MARSGLLVSLFLALLPVALGADASLLCGILDARVAIVNDKLYWTSGNYTFDDGEALHTDPNLYSLDLNKQLDISGAIPLDALQRTSLPTTDLSGGRSPISGGYSGAFFYDHTMMYAYAAIVGLESNGDSNTLWSYNTTNSSWALSPVEGGKIAFGDNSEGVYASDPASGLSFYTGGYKMAFNDTNNGIVRFDAPPDGGEPQWNFATVQNGTQVPNILKGVMSYVRKGKAGVLIAFGGFDTSHRGTQFGPGWDWDFRPMSTISVYDIYSNIWYDVNADGDIPEERAEFCAGVSSAPDDSSFQIVIHGGYNLLTGKTLSDVYALSIPSFTWIQLDVANDPDLIISPSGGRNRHKCQTWKERQLIVAGGNSANNSNKCNDTYPPVKVLDTVSLNWLTSISPNVADYEVPPVVQRKIGGTSSGGATKTSPTGGWNSTDLASVFSQTVAKDTYVSPAESSSSASASPTSEPKTTGTPSKKTNAGAIAGGVVGGVVFLAICSVLTWWIILRRRKSQSKPQAEGYAYNGKPELHSDPISRPVVFHEADASHPELSMGDQRAELPPYSKPVEMYAGPMSPR